MRRVFRVLTVVVLVGALLVAVAAPALAQATPVEPIQPPPNCEHGQDQAWINGWEYNKPEQRNDEQAKKHFLKFVDCATGQSPSEGS
jgi:hypothetical protein